MKVIIRKMWITEAHIDTPDGLSTEELIQWLDSAVGPVANEDHIWDWTICTNKEDGEEIVVFD